MSPAAGARTELRGTYLDALYLSTLILAAGAHPFYSRMDTTLADLPRFGLRYSGLIWDNRLRPMKDPEQRVRFGNGVGERLLHWQRLAGLVDHGDGRRRLILHLINAPAEDRVLRNPGMKTSPPLRDFPLRISLPEEARVQGVWHVPSTETISHSMLPHQRDATGVNVVVPEVRFWTVVTVDYIDR